MSTFLSQVVVLGLVVLAVGALLLITGVIGKPGKMIAGITDAPRATQKTREEPNGAGGCNKEMISTRSDYFGGDGTTLLTYWWITITTTSEEKKYPLVVTRKEAVSIGKHENCHIRINSSYVSRYHVNIAIDDEGMFLQQDARSHSLVFLGDDSMPITETPITAGLAIRLGDVKLLFTYENPFASNTNANSFGTQVIRRDRSPGKTIVRTRN